MTVLVNSFRYWQLWKDSSETWKILTHWLAMVNMSDLSRWPFKSSVALESSFSRTCLTIELSLKDASLTKYCRHFWTSTLSKLSTLRVARIKQMSGSVQSTSLMEHNTSQVLTSNANDKIKSLRKIDEKEKLCHQTRKSFLFQDSQNFLRLQPSTFVANALCYFLLFSYDVFVKWEHWAGVVKKLVCS